ncbi:MAG: CvpA family protein [Pirellulaceae bacterium]
MTARLGIDKPWAPFLSMLILYVGTSLVIWVAYGYIRETIKRMHLKTFDAQTGGLLGAFKGALLCMVVTMFAVTLLGDNVRRAVVESRSGGFIAKSINKLNAVVPDELHTILNPFVEDFNSQLAQPLPASSTSSADGWFGTFTSSKVQPTDDSNQGYEGGFLPTFRQSSESGFQQEIAPGLNIEFDANRVIDEVGNRLKQEANDFLNSKGGQQN